MDEEKKMVIGITSGDINGISIEVIMKALSDTRILQLCTPVIYGSSKVISYHKKMLDSEQINSFNYLSIQQLEQIKPGRINVLNCWKDDVTIEIGKATEEAGKCALEALEYSTNDLISGKIDGLVTAPVNKKSISLILPEFQGQTEFFTQKCNLDESLMFLIGESLRVGLVTNHIPVKDIPGEISVKKIADKLAMMNNSLKSDFQITKPKIAVLGLNPHAGDNGLIGKEESEVIVPAIELAKSKGILAFGPFAADGLFGSQAYMKFDAVLAMYHDQGLVAFKSLSFGSGVNFTAGLPIIRTSPDHGTAYEIAGKGTADETSFRNALFTAKDFISNRKQYKQMHQSPLSRNEISKEVN